MLEQPVSEANRRIAMLIDGDITQPSLIDKIVVETGRYGVVTIRRIYGDWTEPNMKSWKDTLHINVIQPVQQFRYTTGKNATDSALIIDAMDILYGGTVNGFCLVSSDSDYTRLATRIREKGLFVMGIGKKGTPRAFVNACEVFVYTENLVSDIENSDTFAPHKKAKVGSSTPAEPLSLLKSSVEAATQDSGWAFLGAVGTTLRQRDPSFDPRSYGHKQLSQLFRAYPEEFEIKERRSPHGPSVIHIRVRI